MMSSNAYSKDDYENEEDYYNDEEYRYYYDHDWDSDDTDSSNIDIGNSDRLSSFLKEEFDKEKEMFYDEEDIFDESIKEFCSL